MQLIFQYRIELIFLAIFSVINSILAFKLERNELKFKYYILANIILMLFGMSIMIYMKKSIEFILGMCMMFIIFEIYDLFIKRRLNKR